MGNIGFYLKFSIRSLGSERRRSLFATFAMANAPDVMLAGEATGNLDTATGDSVMNMPLDARRETGTTLVVVTHDAQVAARANRTLTMQDGLLAGSRTTEPFCPAR